MVFRGTGAKEVLVEIDSERAIVCFALTPGELNQGEEILAIERAIAESTRGK